MPVKNPGKILEQELLARPAHLRQRLLELAERHAKATGDFERRGRSSSIGTSPGK